MQGFFIVQIWLVQLFLGMVTYNSRDWLSFIFNIHRGDTLRKLAVYIVLICLYSWVVAFIELRDL